MTVFQKLAFSPSPWPLLVMPDSHPAMPPDSGWPSSAPRIWPTVEPPTVAAALWPASTQAVFGCDGAAVNGSSRIDAELAA
ncbi:hypothetical protein C1Y40_04623 [Mycobacterium talmoniae]|uniref:Uncharacterized protein n=1 Tax=Mycobacterium talmoniae TaxID=1858794 RepID=A0A2S8BEU0_9MYCO|nr:hypothetical protein C1Y40_04623 [Mycobacterium talmoniae]